MWVVFHYEYYCISGIQYSDYFFKISISSEHWRYGDKYTYMDWATKLHCLDFWKYTIKI